LKNISFNIFKDVKNNGITLEKRFF